MISPTASGSAACTHSCQESLERLCLALEASGVGTWDYDLRTGRVTWDQTTARLYGISLGDFDGTPEGVDRCIHPEDRLLVARICSEAMASAREIRTEHRAVWPDGTVRWIAGCGRYFYDGDGRPIRATGTATDITDRKRTEQALEQSERRFRLLAENVQDVIFRCEKFPHRHYSYVSPAVTLLSGYTPEEWCADPGLAFRVVHPEDRPGLEARGRGEQPLAPVVTMRLTHKDGRTFWVEQRAVEIRDASGQVVAVEGIVRDITQRKLAEERERTLRAELTHLARLGTAGQMAAAIAHELNQPLAAIVNYIGACRELMRNGRLHPSVLQDTLRSVSSESQRAGEIIRRLRAFVRKQDPRHVPVDLNSLINEAASLLRSEFLQRGITLTLGLAQSLPGVPGDPVQIVQVIVNLITNALDAMDCPTAHGRELIIQSAAAAGGGGIVRVIDRGSGIPAAVREHLFEEFFTTKASGLGLGLPISRSIIEAHGGHLTARPNPEGGAIFEFELPRE